MARRPTFRLGHKVIDNREKIAQLVAGSCAKAGIKVTDDQDAEFNATRLPASDFDAALFAWVGTPFKSSATGNYSTGGGSNYNKYSNPEVDKLFQQANVELDPAKRVELLNQMDEVMAEDFASLPLYQFSDMVAAEHRDHPDADLPGPGRWRRCGTPTNGYTSSKRDRVCRRRGGGRSRISTAPAALGATVRFNCTFRRRHPPHC